MKAVYFGPEKNVPSWYWVGKDIADHLSNKIPIKFFKSIDEIDYDSVVFWIKSPPSQDKLDLIKKKKLRIIYFPIDCYNSSGDVNKDKHFVTTVKSIVLHTSSMKELFDHKNINYIDHYNKFGINGLQRKPENKFLWVGGYQYFPYIVYYVRKNNIKFHIIALTDQKCESAIKAANVLSNKIGLNCDFSSTKKFSEFTVVEWTEERQKELLKTCLGAFDYKHVDDFNQKYKPPTKIQKYLSSFVPTAVNKESFSYQYASGLGFNMCSPEEMEIWQSENYKLKTIEIGKEIANKIDINTISQKYLEFMQCV